MKLKRVSQVTAGFACFLTLALGACQENECSDPNQCGSAAGGASTGGAKDSSGGAGVGGRTGGATSGGSESFGGDLIWTQGGAGGEGNIVPASDVTSIDMLFMIDNSVSMADKQALLKQAVPEMVKRLVTPDCVTFGSDGKIVGRQPSAPDLDGKQHCPDGTRLEFKPVEDIHLGVITSSLGSHGYSAVCDTVGTDIDPNTGLLKGKDKNDHAYLIPLVRPPESLATPPKYTGLDANEPFLNWGGGTQADLDTLTTKFANHVAAAGESGCGFESQLEAVYRFLIEPTPPKSIGLGGTNSMQATPSTETDPVNGVDSELLASRAEFLRPDSLVAVVALTDENDCSVMEGGKYYPFAKFGYLAMNTGTRMKAPTSTCAANPNDKCCDTCYSTTANEGCEQVFNESCTDFPSLTVPQDEGQERCFDQRRRFGFDLLYPVERYIDGLTRNKVHDSLTGELVNNPLFVAEDGTVRPTDLVFFSGIIGVPWQDLATPESLTDPNHLAYLKTEELDLPVDAKNGKTYSRWDVILGKQNHHPESRFCEDDPSHPSCGAQPVPPLDPFMVESIEARAPGLVHPIVDGEKTTLPGDWNNINGSEQLNADNEPASNKRNDLQYACIFPLKDYGAEVDETECVAKGTGCDCDDEGILKQRPLCRSTPSGALEKAQYWGKAYPSLRILEVLHGIPPENAIVSSICPKVATKGPSFGFNPPVTTIIDRLTPKLDTDYLE